jgi:hypothetical protein
MTNNPQVDHPVSTEVLDLYDALPPANAGSNTGADNVAAMIRGVGRNLAALIGMFAVALVAFIACTVLFSSGVGLAVLVVGPFILVGCLMVAGWAARLTRLLLGYAGVSLPPTQYPVGAGAFAASYADSGMVSPGVTCCSS